MRVHPQDVQGSDEDLEIYDELDLENEGLLEPGVIDAVYMWGIEKEDGEGRPIWAIKLGVTLPEVGVKGHWWIRVGPHFKQRWANFIRIVDPRFAESNEEKDLNPTDYVGKNFKVRIGYGKSGEGRIWPQRFMTETAGSKSKASSGGRSAPKTYGSYGAAPQEPEPSYDDLPF